MATEKNMPWGRRLSAPLGVVLVASGLITVLFHLYPRTFSLGA